MSNLGNRNRLNHALRTDEGNEGAAVVLNNEIKESIRATEALGKNQTTRNDFNNRLMKMIKWVKDKMRSGAIVANEDELVRELSESEKRDGINYHKSTHDFKYENLPSSIVKSFVSDPSQKYKKGGMKRILCVNVVLIIPGSTMMQFYLGLIYLEKG